MTRLPQQQALEVIRNKILTVEDRYDGYHTDLVKTLHDILDIVSNEPHNIRQQISRRVEALGELISENGGNIE